MCTRPWILITTAGGGRPQRKGQEGRVQMLSRMRGPRNLNVIRGHVQCRYVYIYSTPPAPESERDRAENDHCSKVRTLQS
jgi:hypothetical protein